MHNKRHDDLPDLIHCIEHGIHSCKSQIPDGACSMAVFCPWLNRFENTLEFYEVEGQPDYIRFVLAKDLNHCYVMHKRQIIFQCVHPFKRCGSNEE